MHIVLEYIRVNKPNLIEIHCLHSEAIMVSRALDTLTGKSHLPIDVCGDLYCIYITDSLTMSEAEALLIALRRWKIDPDKVTREKLHSVAKLEQFWERLQKRQSVHNLEQAVGLIAYDYADTEVGE